MTLYRASQLFSTECYHDTSNCVFRSHYKKRHLGNRIENASLRFKNLLIMQLSKRRQLFPYGTQAL